MSNRLKQRQQLSRQSAIAAQLRSLSQSLSKSVSQGTVLGYDANNGGYRVSTQAGRSLVVRSLTSGAIASGRAVSFYSPRLSSRPLVTDFPHR